MTAETPRADLDCCPEVPVPETLENEPQLLQTLIDNLPEILFAKDAAGRFGLSRAASVRLLQSLRAGEEQFRRTIEFAPIPVIMHTEDGEVLQISRTWTELTGYRLQDLPTFTAWLERAYGAGADAVRGRVQQLFQGQRSSISIDFPIRTRDGATRHWSFSASSPGTLRDGRRFVVGMAIDLTECKRAEQALREREADLNHAQAMAQIGSWRSDLRTHEIHWSDETYRIFGVAKGTPMTHQMFLDLVHPDDKERVERAWQAALAGAPYDLEHRILVGGVKWVRERAELEFDAQGTLRGGFGTVQDITAEKQAEAQLCLQSAALEAAANGIAITDRNGVILWVNPAFARMTGYAPEEAVGRTPAILKSGLQEPAFYEHLWATIRRGEVWHGELINRRKDGSLHPEEMTITPVPDGHGGISHFIAIKQDITERKQAEEALKEADRRKDEFLAMLAHELRNPLAPISNAVSLLQQVGPDEPRLNWCREVIERQTGQLTRLVDDLLDVSRVSRGKIQLRKEPLDLATVVQQSVETSRPLIEARGHRLTVTLASTPVRVAGDVTRLAQVVSNLLNNAAKYTDEHGCIWLTVEREPETAREAVVRVRDTGRGIDPAALPHLFDLFYQVDRNLDRSEGGLGIGLALARSLVEMHGGRVQAFSAGRGQGSEFVVRLPSLPDAPPAAPGRAAGAGDRSGHALRILVVDDNRDAAESLALLLQLDGHEVLMARDGRQAVEVALAQRPAVVLLDIGLPGLDGYQVCRALRAGGLAETLIVALTGYGQEEDRRRSQEAGFDLHQVKPVNLQALRTLLAQHAANLCARAGKKLDLNEQGQITNDPAINDLAWRESHTGRGPLEPHR